MSNPIVYSTGTGRIVSRSRWSGGNVQLQNLPRGWFEAERVTPERHAKAKQALREAYIIKAAAVGMTLESYITRFNIKL